MPKQREVLIETWLYAGQRLDAKDALFHAWVDESGRELHFKKLPGSMPGHGYAVEVKREGDRVSVSGSPRYLAEQSTRQATPAQLDTWRAEHAAARAAVDAKRVEKAAAQDDELERALEVVRRHYSRLRTAPKRGAFLNHLLGETTRPPRKESQGSDA